MTTERVVGLIGVVSRAAEINDASVELDQLLQLLPDGTSSEEIAEAIRSSPVLSGTVVLEDGYISAKETAGASGQQSKRRLQAMKNISEIRAMMSKLGSPEILSLAVSGSNSYLSAGATDDTDLFCITDTRRLWPFLARGLVLSRLSGLTRKPSSRVDFSCLMDEEYARKTFWKDQGPLFARDALMASVVSGAREYAELLRSAGWMRAYFPKLYSLKTATDPSHPFRKTARRQRSSFLNLLLFRTLGTYIRTKAYLHNRILAKKGANSALFRPRMGPGHLVYESERYLALRSLYSGLRPEGARNDETGDAEGKGGERHDTRISKHG